MCRYISRLFENLPYLSELELEAHLSTVVTWKARSIYIHERKHEFCSILSFSSPVHSRPSRLPPIVSRLDKLNTNDPRQYKKNQATCCGLHKNREYISDLVCRLIKPRK